MVVPKPNQDIGASPPHQQAALPAVAKEWSALYQSDRDSPVVLIAVRFARKLDRLYTQSADFKTRLYFLWHGKLPPGF